MITSRIVLDEEAVKLPRYAVPPPHAAMAFASGSTSRPSSTLSSRGGSCGSTLTKSEARSSFLIAAVAENRAREIGICAIDLVSPYELLLWTVIDSHSYVNALSLLKAYQPVEILVTETSKAKKVNEEICKNFAGSSCRVVPLARKYFDQTKGAEDIKRVMANSVDINIGRNYVAMASVACVMKYIEYIQGVYIAEKSMKIVISPSICKLLMDQATISSLELVQGAQGRKDNQSLCKMLNNTQTSAGNRLLRSTILQPTCHLKTIHARHEVVGVFLDNPAWYFDVMEELREFVDLDRLLSQLVFVPKAITPRASRIAIGSVIALKHMLDCLPKMVSCLEAASVKLDQPCTLLDSIIVILRDEQFTGIKADIERVVNDRVKVCRSAAQKRIQECFAVRAGVDGMLDVARRTYLDTIEKIHEVVHTYKENIGFPIRLNYTARRGYHLAVPVNIKELPSSFIERVTNRNVICCSTKVLVSLNVRLTEAVTAVYKLSNDVIQQLLDKIRPRASAMHAMVESIALLDMLLSFVNVVALSPPDRPYTRPTVTEHGNFIIKKGRHPLVECVLKDRRYIPSDTFFDPSSTFHLVTGPNCAGKSTYLRATALITIMAQMGCYVPASDAAIPIRDRICTRFGTSDDMEENASSFAVEMTETAFILETCTSRSLVLIDELGRGTANDEGAAIAWSIGEELIQRGAFTCFATHYHQLNYLSQLYPRCRCYHMGAGITTNSFHFRYVLKDGPFPSTDMYGIKTAALSGLPTGLIREAEEIYQTVQLNRETHENSMHEVSTINCVEKINRNLLHHLYVLRCADLNFEDLRRQLHHLQTRFLAPTAKLQ
ncbi:dna mismatch repair protein [Plasmopara halstedii]|uniref:Dna mismatch repair protein n=1 Tax=Plasmopara halstedii TaxID=4781 RepID=A0A0P1B012_PLAHL|nr:dna mismatch repair protein [Plasmopara halstedii]CEG46488.1 dna mismatch repair protein [Plasmopara halstedii]|eukprot:XP_024582857.1 dna mismatch repair protein [Plasmopara halstedii]